MKQRHVALALLALALVSILVSPQTRAAAESSSGLANPASKGPITPMTTAMSSGSTEAVVNGTFENGGRDSSDWYFNIQGDDDAYRAWGAADFDADLLGFAYPIDDITAFNLTLTQANAGFTNDGTVGFWITEDTTTTIGAGSTLAWADSPQSNGLGGQLTPRTFLGTGAFIETSSGDADTYALDALPGFAAVEPYLIDQINNGDTVRIIVAPTVTDTAVTATWAGYSSFSYDGPTLGVEATEATELTPPRVSSAAPTDDATAVSLDAAISLTFNEPVDIDTDAFALECPAGTDQAFGIAPALPVTDVTSVTLTPSALLPPGSSCVLTATAAAITDRDATPDPLDGDGDGTGGDDYALSFTTINCGESATLIHAVQGSGAASPEDGNTVTIEGVVVGDFQRAPGKNQLSGFFLQEESDDWDADDATSEGIFVYEGSSSLLDVAVGDQVRLTGEVDEAFDLTQIESLTELGRCSSGHPVTPTAVTLPESADGELERVEGMLVEIASDMTVAQNYFLGRYGQMTLSSSGRMFQPTNLHLPGSPEADALAQANARNLLILDDGMDVSSCGDNPEPVPYLGPPPPDVIRAGDSVANLVGVLDYGTINSGAPCFDPTSFARDYRVHPTQEPVFSPTNPRPAAPAYVGGTLKVASFNVLNYFTTLGWEGDVCGPTGDMECRGAYSSNAFQRQQTKIVEAMCAIDADIFGLMELENQNPANDPEPGDGIDNYVLKDLVDALNDAASPCPDKTFWFTDSPAMGTDAIRQGVIYKTGTVTPTSRAVLTDTGFTDPNDLGEQKSRPAIAETFEDANGERFTVVVNHLKSKGSPCGEGDDDETTGQGNCNGTRTKGADYLVDWLATDPTGSGDPDVLIIGDLNAYAMEDPIMALVDGGYTDLLRAHQGDTAYTYIFDGQSGTLDHGLANDDLALQVTGATAWHINTDEPPVIDYDDYYNPPGYYSPDPYRASDHDPVIVGLRLSQLPYRIQLPLVAKDYGPPSQVLTLGVLGPFTGPSATTGDEFQGAVTMAFDAIDWRIGDYAIEPVWIDSESNPARASQHYEEAILEEGVEAGLLNWHSSVAISCLDVVADHQVPHFAGMGAREVVNETFHSDRERYGYWTTKWWPTPGTLSVAYVEALEHAISSGAWSPAAKTVVISGEDTEWGRAFGDTIKGHFEDAGWVVLGEEYFDPGQTDFSSALALLTAVNPAVVAGSSFSADSVFALLNQAYAADLQSVMIADGLGWLGDWYSATGDASNYKLDQTPPGWITPEAQAFAAAYEARFGSTPSSAAGMAYDAANFFISLAQQVYAETGELSSETLYAFAQDELWTGQWTYTDGIMMEAYKYTEETIPDPVLGAGYYVFPVVQYFDGAGVMVYPPEWAEQPFTPPGG